MSATAPAHIARVLEALVRRGATVRQTDPITWTATCPDCKKPLTVKDADWNEAGTVQRARLWCAGCDEHSLLRELGLRHKDLFSQNGAGPDQAETEPLEDLELAPVADFAAVDEPGAGAILGTEDRALIPENGDAMAYGDGGAGKTTLLFDLAFHLAAGVDWLGIPVPRPVTVGIIENEGPRPMLRRKLRRKLEAWNQAGRPPVADRIHVLERPWGQFTFASEQWRERIAEQIAARGIDVLIVGPLTAVGMDEAGTLQQVQAFMRLVEEVRRQSGRRLTVIIIHHENKSGAVSGAWERAGDTLLHVQGAGNGHTIVYIQKARWDNERHGTALKLAWTDGEGFRLEGDRDYLAEITALYAADGKWRTAKHIAAPAVSGGIGANVDTVKKVIKDHPETFVTRSGEDAKAVGFHPNATVYKLLTQAPESVESNTDLPGGGDGVGLTDSSRRESVSPESHPLDPPEVTQTPESGTGTAAA